jgi:protochlorophyllide reductase
MQTHPARHVLITGGSSGIGLEACRQLVEIGHRLTVLCRDAATGDRLRSELRASIATPICDMADLESVEACASELLKQDTPIDTLVLNAGLQYSGAKEPRWSAQGFELTFAVNHLAHQALLQRLVGLLAQGDAPRLVITASEVHDPSSGGGKVGRPAGVGTLVGLRQGPGAPMLDGSVFDAEKAYKDSKLCNLLMAREAARRLQTAGLAVPVVAWSPGLVIPRSEGGFFRYSRVHNPAGQLLFALVARDLLQLTERPQQAGALLTSLATSTPELPEPFEYWSNRVLGPGRRHFERAEPSAEARDPVLAKELWELSAQHLGLRAELNAPNASPAVADRGDTPAAPH